jgi:hypothetical protein
LGGSKAVLNWLHAAGLTLSQVQISLAVWTSLEIWLKPEDRLPTHLYMSPRISYTTGTWLNKIIIGGALAIATTVGGCASQQSTASTSASVPTHAAGERVDQANPRPPCPSGTAVSAAHGDVYCVWQQQTQATAQPGLSSCIDAWNSPTNPYRPILSGATNAGVATALVVLFADARCGVAANVPGEGDGGSYTAWVQGNGGFTLLEGAGGPAGVASSVAISQQLVEQASAQANATLTPDGSLAAMPGASIVQPGVNADGTSG